MNRAKFRMGQLRNAIPYQSDILTQQEIVVIWHVAHGFSDRQVAAAMRITAATVQRHIHNIYDKTSVANRIKLIHYALRVGIIRFDQIHITASISVRPITSIMVDLEEVAA